MRDDKERTVADDLRHWLDGDAIAPPAPVGGDEHEATRLPRRPRRGALIAALLGPWLAVAAVIVVGRDGPPRPAHDRPVHAASASARPSEQTGPSGQPPPSGQAPSSPRTQASQTGQTPRTDESAHAHTATVPAAVAPTAVRLVRDAVTRGDGPATSALDVAAPEHPVAVAPGTWLVRVHAVVLHGDRRRWRRTTQDVWAVPIGRRRGRLVGVEHPWRVATVEGRVTRATWHPATIDRATLGAALRRVGLTPPSRPKIERHPTEPGIIRASADGDRRVWLRRTGPSLEVLGAAPADDAS